MARLIDADALKATFREVYKINSNGVIGAVIDDTPTIDAVPVRHGKWIKIAELQNCHDLNGYETWGIKYMCESCGFQTFAIEGHFAQYKYCPQCGARMDKE